MSNFIRGGQLTIHSIRMNMQVWKILFRACLAIMLVGVFFCFWKDMKPQDWKNVGGLLKRDLAFNDNAAVKYHGMFGEVSITKKQAKGHYVFNDLSKKIEATLYKGLITGGVSSFLVVFATLIYFRRSGRRHKGVTEVRGVFLSSRKELLKDVYENNKLYPYSPVKVMNVPYPIIGEPHSFTSGEQGHTLFLGTTGSGKTTAIQDIVTTIWGRSGKAIIIDIKGDYIKKFYNPRTDIILNPLDKRGSNWHIFGETNPLKGYATIAKSLIPIDSSDPTWTDAARLVFGEMASSYSKSGISLAELVDKILKTDTSTLSKILQKTCASKVINENLEKAALSVLMVLSAYLRPLKLYDDSNNCFSITDWVKSKKGSKEDIDKSFLFIGSRPESKRELNPLVSTQVDIAINAMRSLSRSSNVPHIWFILDELTYFDSPIPSLIDGINTARSYGGCFVLGVQDMSALSKIYSKERSESIANNCNTKVFMKISGAETADWCSENIGKGEIEEWDEGISYGASEMRDGVNMQKSKKMKSAVLPSELTLMKTGEGILKFSGYKPARTKVRKRTQYIFPDKEPYIENTELKKRLEKEVDEQIRHTEIIEEKILLAEENKPTSSDSGEGNAEGDDAASVADNVDITTTNDNTANNSISLNNKDTSKKENTQQTSKENEQNYAI